MYDNQRQVNKREKRKEKEKEKEEKEKEKREREKRKRKEKEKREKEKEKRSEGMAGLTMGFDWPIYKSGVTTCEPLLLIAPHSLLDFHRVSILKDQSTVVGLVSVPVCHLSCLCRACCACCACCVVLRVACCVGC